MRASPLRSIFLVAAERQFENMEGEYAFEVSGFACDNICSAAIAHGDFPFSNDYPPEHNFFYQLYHKDALEAADGILDLAWWPCLDGGGWDHESRILALLLCAEMLKRER